MFSWFLPLPPPATLGALEFSLLYDQDNSSLHCTIIKAKVGEGPLGLLWADMGSQAPVCCLVQLWQWP